MASTLRFISVPESILSRTDLSATDKGVYGLLRFCQYDKGECWPSHRRLATVLDCDVRTISASIERLAAAGLVEVRQVEGRLLYHVNLVKDDRYLRVTEAVLRLPRLSVLAKLVLAMIAFGTQGNGDRHAFAGQDTMAARLGCSRRSILRAIASLQDAGLIEVRRRGPRSNQYTLTPQGEAAIVAQQAGKRCDNFAQPYREAENESSKELKRTGADQEIPSAGLSGSRPVASLPDPQERAVQRLTGHGVHQTVAAAIVYEQHHPPDSIDQAIDNALLRQAQHRQSGSDRLKPFRLAAYIVGSLNQARREAHVVKPSQLFARAKALHRRRQPWAPLPAGDFEERRRRCIAQLRKVAS